MATPKLGSPVSTESILLHLLARVDAARQRALVRQRKRVTSRAELRTLDFWRAVIAECLASFLYVFLLCSTHLTWTGSIFIFGPAPNWLVIALTSGFAMATLIHCFGHISGGHVNPVVTCAFIVTGKVNIVRGIFYIAAHFCGAIAGAAMLYGVTVTGNQSMGPLGITAGHDSLNAWQVLAVEFLLTFVIVFTTFATADPNRKSFGSDSFSIGLAYLVASLTGLPASGASMNPARSLGPAFVMNRWTYHWVYWLGPLAGSIAAAFIYQFIFDTRKLGKMGSDTFDDLERESNVEDDYEDPDMNKAMTNHKAMYSSASAGSSGSSSGQRSNHTQHSVVSVHGPQPYDAYRPMIGAFTPSSTIQEVSPTIYNEPTGPGTYYDRNSDRNGGVNGNSNTSSNSNGPTVSGNTFFCPPSSSARFGHNTMRASLPHHRINYEGSVISSVPVNPKF